MKEYYSIFIDSSMLMAKFTLFVDIQEGFKDDTLIVKVNGNDVFVKEHITTNLLYGPAASFSTDINEGLARMEAVVPHRNLQCSYEFQVDSDMYIAISIIDPDGQENIRFISSDHPFGYF
ncbi:MAG TPA: hypothetical protein VFY68_08920 [Nitrososphaeraceae archaeon]|nr:hypothetical protein [Nitrososphaeraceae archaeon]